MFRLIHISDIHLGPMPRVHWRNLLSKRLTGYINWQRKRAREFFPHVLNNLTAHIRAANPDHIIVTGDLVNLALPEEITRARAWLKDLGSGRDVSIICGNHDAYIKDMLETAITSWQDYLIGDDGIAVRDNSSFPILRRRGPISLILVNTALPTKPFDATGVFDQDQAEKMEKLLHQEEGRCRIIAIHHPPFANATVPSKRLIGDKLFRQVVKASGADLVLHGHTHLDTLEWIDGPVNKVPVICVPAGGQEVAGKKPAAHYNLFEIQTKGNRWQIQQNKFGYDKDNFNIQRLDKSPLL